MALFRCSNDVKSISVLKQAADIPFDGNFHNIAQCPKPTHVIAYCYISSIVYVLWWDVENNTGKMTYNDGTGWETNFTVSARFQYSNGYVQYKPSNANWAVKTRFIIAE